MADKSCTVWLYYNARALLFGVFAIRGGGCSRGIYVHFAAARESFEIYARARPIKN
jgi:hypothetical protein